jgi:hypothetical protein
VIAASRDARIDLAVEDAGAELVGAVVAPAADVPVGVHRTGVLAADGDRDPIGVVADDRRTRDVVDTVGPEEAGGRRAPAGDLAVAANRAGREAAGSDVRVAVADRERRRPRGERAVAELADVVQPPAPDAVIFV